MTEERRIQLVAEVDATGTRAGFTEIAREAGTMADAVGRRSRQAEDALAGIGAGAGRSAPQLAAAQRSFETSITRQIAVQERLAAGTRNSSAYFEVQARQLGVSAEAAAPYLAQLRAIEAAQARANVQVAGAAAPVRQLGMSAAQTANNLRMVPAQFTDIVTSLQGGQAPLTVFIQQGGQLRDIFGSSGAAARALGGYVASLVTPMTVGAAAVIGLAVAYHYGAEEAKAYTRALILTNNASGETADRMAESARRIGQIAGDQGVAAAAMASLAGSGRVPAENMQRFAQVAVEAQRVIGRSVEDTVSDFTALGKAPLTALAQINDKYHFITAATYAQVKALLDQGRAAEAANVAQQAYADGIDKQRQKVLDSLTDWERGWIRIKKAAGGALDAVLDFGRGATNFEKINSLLKQYETASTNKEAAEKLNDGAAAKRWQVQMDRAKTEINTLRNKGDVAKEGAKAEAESQKRNEAEKKWLEDGDKYLTRKAQLEKEITKARNEGAAAGQSQSVIDKRVSDIRKGFADIFNDGVDSNIEAIKRRAAVEDVLTQRIIARISAQRSSGAIRDEDAISQTAKAEDDAFARKRADLESELVLIKQKQNSQKDQAAKSGEIAVLDEQRISRQIQLTTDLFALEQQRTRAGLDASANAFDQAMGQRDQSRQQVRDIRDYNEEIGTTAREILELRNARLEELAARKDADADIAEGLDLTGERAKLIRDEAKAIRDRAAASRDGFLKERDPWTALTLSAKTYAEEASNTGKLVGDALTNAFRGAEDAFVSFVTTGKLNFTSFANSILADFARIAAKQGLASLFSMAVRSIGGFFGSSPSSSSGGFGYDYGALAGARANGGPVDGGASYLVGERGPEIFTPSSNGRIIANHQMGGGDINISMQTNIAAGKSESAASGGNGTDARAMADGLNAKWKQFLAGEMRQGGLLWNMQQGRA